MHNKDGSLLTRMKIGSRGRNLLLSSIVLVLAGILVTGCAKKMNEPTGPGSSSPTVSLSVLFSKSGTAGLMKTSATAQTDSLRIDSAVIVFSRIKLEAHIDSVIADTTEGAPDVDIEQDINVTFKGPFVVHVRDTVAINFASGLIPAGTYTGIKFKIHRLLNGESFDDSDERNFHRIMDNDSAITGSSITVWGAVKKNGVWTDFTFNFNGEVEFKIKGTFVVPPPPATFDLALNFNIASWFVNPFTGTLLDPTDVSHMNRELIRRAIYSSLGKGMCGRNRGDGHVEGFENGGHGGDD